MGLKKSKKIKELAMELAMEESPSLIEQGPEFPDANVLEEDVYDFLES